MSDLEVGKTVWVRDPMRGDNKFEGVLEFQKGDEVVVTFSEYEYLCVFKITQIVDAPTKEEIEIENTNRIINEAYEVARGQDWNFHRVLEEKGYKLVKIKCRGQ